MGVFSVFAALCGFARSFVQLLLCRVIVGVAHPYIAGGLAMDATGIGTGHNDSFVYQARAFLDEVAGRDELPRNGSFADGLHNLEVKEAVVRAAANGSQTAVGA